MHIKSSILHCQGGLGRDLVFIAFPQCPLIFRNKILFLCLEYHCLTLILGFKIQAHSPMHWTYLNHLQFFYPYLNSFPFPYLPFRRYFRLTIFPSIFSRWVVSGVLLFRVELRFYLPLYRIIIGLFFSQRHYMVLLSNLDRNIF